MQVGVKYEPMVKYLLIIYKEAIMLVYETQYC